MIQIKGKYNTANVMIDEIDGTTREQIQTFVNVESFKDSYIAIMPDCHKGIGSCIGFTMKMNERIIPDVVGVDIGCGMLSAKFDTDNLNCSDFDRFVKENIPSGFSVCERKFDGDDFFSKTAERLGLNVDRVSKSIGTLGGGNHFIEAGFGKDGKLWVTIHSGSRNFGLQIAKHHGQSAKNECEKHSSETHGMPFLLVESKEGQQYIEDQIIGVKYASLNRKTMIEKLGKFFGDPIDSIESIHNFIDIDGMIRKGATPAKDGQRVIIPFNMRDGIALCVGKGNAKYNFSAPHGAGRILSRTQAKARLNVEEFKNSMDSAGVYTTTATKETLDEAPNAYKEMQMILDNIKETVDVVDFVKPVYNFKACE